MPLSKNLEETLKKILHGVGETQQAKVLAIKCQLLNPNLGIPMVEEKKGVLKVIP